MQLLELRTGVFCCTGRTVQSKKHKVKKKHIKEVQLVKSVSWKVNQGSRCPGCLNLQCRYHLSSLIRKDVDVWVAKVLNVFMCCDVHAVAVQCVPCKVGSGAVYRRQRRGSEVAETGELRLHCNCNCIRQVPCLTSEWVGLRVAWGTWLQRHGLLNVCPFNNRCSEYKFAWRLEHRWSIWVILKLETEKIAKVSKSGSMLISLI